MEGLLICHQHSDSRNLVGNVLALESHSNYLDFIKLDNKVADTTSCNNYSSEQTLPSPMHREQGQFTANKSPFLQSYLHKVNPDT